MIDIVVPQIGEAVAELTLTQWLKKIGDPIHKGDVLFEIDSDKAIVEVEAFIDGILSEILYPDGSSVMPQQVVARVRGADESPTPFMPSVVREQVTSDDLTNGAVNDQKVSPVARRLAADLGVQLHQLHGSGPAGRITSDDVRAYAEAVQTSSVPVRKSLATPKAKRLAREQGVDLSNLVGTGVNGLISALDVERAAALFPAPPVIAPLDAGVEQIPASKLRQRIAERTTAAKQQIPHFYLLVDVDMTAADALRGYCTSRLKWERPPTYTDLIVRACGLALHTMPEKNRSYSDGGLIQRREVNIGVAVSTDGGLVVPSVKNVPRLSLLETSQALGEVASRAREGRLRPTDLGEKSMVVSNLGMYAVDAFIAIIDMPDPMILAVGRVADRVVPYKGQVAIRPMCTLTLSVDHRALDGVDGARFLEMVKDQLEFPYRLLGDGA